MMGHFTLSYILLHHSKDQINRWMDWHVFFLFLCSASSWGQTTFELLSSEKTGVGFQNSIMDTKEQNILLYANYYGGAGVGIGDFNNDGLLDIYFAGNLESDQLYLNLGDLTFENITEQSGIEREDTWSSSVTLADVNADGFLDIYVTKELYDFQPEKRQNRLYINQGDLTFKEEAQQWGVADNQRSRGAVFLDYDKDGDLDLYVLNQPPNPGSYSPFFGTKLLLDQYTSRLYQNIDNKTFEDVTAQAGVFRTGFPNSVVAADFNGDQWPDLYVANDFEAPDFLYMNNRDGTFSYQTEKQLKHISFFSMGVDAADINNDLLNDVMVLDMVAEDNYRLKANMSAMDVDTFWDVVNEGGHYQYMFNTLQLNHGVDSFSDIAQLTGVAATDWSWANLIADFNNDGHKDVFITNGLLRDIRNTDADKKIGEFVLDFANDYVKENPNQGDIQIMDILDLEKVLSLLPSVPMSNYMYQNHGNLSFQNVTNSWGLNQPTFSNGAAYGDLDNDGDLEIVINNVNDDAFIYKNNTIENSTEKSASHYLRVQLANENPALNHNSTIIVHQKEQSQMIETTTYRGMYSSSEMTAHFGLGQDQKVDSLEVYWSDGTLQIFYDVAINTTLTIDSSAGTSKSIRTVDSKTIFSEITSEIVPQISHRENMFDDYSKQVLLPHQLSRFGPALAVADINGDGLDDFYFGGASGQSSQLMIQQNDGSFVPIEHAPWERHRILEDISALFFDANNDQWLDLIVLSGGNEFAPRSSTYQDRLYLNKGNGLFEYHSEALPKIFESGAVVKAIDFDNDGDLDLFIGNAFVPWNYPESPKSYVLENNDGIFQIHRQSETLFSTIGMVTDACVLDYNQDGFDDLVLVGHWMPITFIENQGGSLYLDNRRTREEQKGWWFCIEAADLDLDGSIDLLVGNLGENYKYKASMEEPFEAYYHDFDEDGTNDIVLTYYNYGIQYPLRGFSCSSTQVPTLKRQIGSYNLFAQMDVSEVYGDKRLEDALHLQAFTFSSLVLTNDGYGFFVPKNLPVQAQFSSINDFVVSDFIGDEYPDILLVGNLFVSEIETTRNDASIGLLLENANQGKKFKSVSPILSGFVAPHDAKSMQTLKTPKGLQLIIGNNDEIMQHFKFW
ncbi:MAG: VCBS repeat-containing protein [Flavobacteriaceae bacterium]|nr:VCBS repeat-containing protein [Flavobacteriaceae bacterium]